jgi:hypothetical protein
MSYTKRNKALAAKQQLNRDKRLQPPPPPRVYRLLKQTKTVLGMVATMTADQFIKLTGFRPSPAIDQMIAQELIAAHERFLEYIKQNEATHKEWKTERDAWTDFVIGELLPAAQAEQE